MSGPDLKGTTPGLIPMGPRRPAMVDTRERPLGHYLLLLTPFAFLEDILTPMERTLVEAGEVEPVRQARLAFQRALRSRFIETVENATGRKVRAFLSQVHFDPDIAAEVFVLEPDGGAPEAVNGVEG
jgi:hypothetical protein